MTLQVKKEEEISMHKFNKPPFLWRAR